MKTTTLISWTLQMRLFVCFINYSLLYSYGEHAANKEIKMLLYGRLFISKCRTMVPRTKDTREFVVYTFLRDHIASTICDIMCRPRYGLVLWSCLMLVNKRVLWQWIFSIGFVPQMLYHKYILNLQNSSMNKRFQIFMPFPLSWKLIYHKISVNRKFKKQCENWIKKFKIT